MTREADKRLRDGEHFERPFEANISEINNNIRDLMMSGGRLQMREIANARSISTNLVNII